MRKFNRIHAICKSIKGIDGQCDLCPSSESIGPGLGKCVRHCYVHAREVFNIATHGNPWGQRATPKHVKSWRKRFNSRIRVERKP